MVDFIYKWPLSKSHFKHLVLSNTEAGHFLSVLCTEAVWAPEIKKQVYDAGLKYVSVVSYTKEICRLGAIYVPRFVSFQESSHCTLGQIFVDIGHEGTLLTNLKKYL